MAVDALAIDIMLPALPNMGDALMVANANDRSLVLTAFLLGFGLPQLVFGPLTDRFGRRAPILIGLAIYVFTALSAPLAPSFAVLLALRFVQGVAAASVRVAMLSAVRDRYSGTAMADIMSLVLAIFLLVPIFMPGVGAGAANAWSVMATDAERHLVFVPTGSASPDYFGGVRPGDNKWADSIVALRSQTGQLVWGFQLVHHDLWDYDTASPPCTGDHCARLTANSGCHPNQQDRFRVRAASRNGGPGLSSGGAPGSAERCGR